ncbi:MAG TPA: hypothetical protein VE890_12270 [Thermoguttaceae bacterium]|nr:hypothetical protein [Thermoguttaceae bacterium]
MVDIADLPEVPTASNWQDFFAFAAGNDDAPGDWSPAPDPVDVAVRTVGDSARVTITWEDDTIRSQWLQITVAANDRTGLTDADVFYFGNAPADAGDSATNAIVNATDEILARNFQHSAVNPAGIDDPYDYNRDGLVNGTDQIIARENQTNPLTMLRLITPPNSEAKGSIEALSTAEVDWPYEAEIDWLYELQRISAKNDASKRSATVARTVDMLIASDWAQSDEQ